MEIRSNFNVVAFLFPFLLLSFTSLLTTFASADHEGESPFSYNEETGKGPKNWGSLDPQWKVCNDGKSQSPMNLDSKSAQVLSNSGDLKLGYKPAPAVLKNRGHDIVVEWQGDAGEIVINGTQYKLVNCHVHTPSEHTVNGARYEQELHIVHRSSAGGLAVIGILYQIGSPDAFLDKLLPHLRTTEAGGVKDLMTVNPEDINRGIESYYRYIGSLTAPPCTEGVIWTVLEKVKTASKEQIQAFRDAVHIGPDQGNARPIQEPNGRPQYFSRP